ncbi:ParB/RepB/Spo0J family partition protein [Comamonas testosteroni]|uniref:ParB/RepB/Spo0J family partition protein n=1 Tax=Comamonas testosteroni TaxID=285 RepID=UPI0026EE21F6|nr:ParB/RepB/Spo0J family partition protein [Comamonas testosteroni]
MSGFKKSRPATDDDAAMPAKAHTGIGMVMGGIKNRQELEGKLAEANQRIAELADSKQAKLLDPTLIRRSTWANRDQANFSGEEWENFKSEISNAKGNIQPIKVRRVFYGKTPSGEESERYEYEAVFGHRRHQACLELSIPVLSLIEDDMDDRSLFEEMDRENRQRKNLSAWEQGQMYNKALKVGLYPSLRNLCESIGVNLSNASRACKIGSLPKEVVDAFSSPLVIQVRWAKMLSDALQSDPDGMLERAKQLINEKAVLAPKQVLDALLQKRKPETATKIEIASKGLKVATFQPAANGKGALIEIDPGSLDEAKQKELMKLIEDFFSKP